MPKVSSSQTAPTNGHGFRVQFGDFCFGFTFHDDDIFERLNESYRVFHSDKPADIKLELQFTGRRDPAAIEAIIAAAQNVVQGAEREALSRLFDINYDPAKRTFFVNAEKYIFETSFRLKPLNRLLRTAYYTASHLKHPGRPARLLVHTCAILRNGEISLFSGPCETGKSTVARLCPGDYGQTLNDEMVLLSWPEPTNHRIMVRSVPIFGDLPFSVNVVAPLSRVFMLKQSQRIKVRRLTRKEAYLRFIYQIINPAYARSPDTRELLSLVADFNGEVTRSTPFYQLEFTRDKDLLWEVEARLAELEGEEASKYAAATKVG